LIYIIDLYFASDEQRVVIKLIAQRFWESKLSAAIITTHASRVDFRTKIFFQKTWVVSRKQRGI